MYWTLSLNRVGVVAVLFEIDHLVSRMSDFDKEAEREKLRKQFAADEKKRESTERMSELLLQGATMTESHCDTCGDPIFRYQGQEFCPTCQAQKTDGHDQATAEQPQQQQPQQQQQPPTDTETQTQTESDTTNIEIEDRTTADTTTAEPTRESASPVSPPTSDGSSDVPASPDARSSDGFSQTSDLSEARQSLVRTITRFAKQAETTDQLGHAREFLAATEDAANALEALERAEK